MASLIDRYVTDLLGYAQEQNVLEDYFNHALSLTGKVETSEKLELPKELGSFLKLLEPADVQAVLLKFIDLSRSHLGLLEVNVFSAVPLLGEQRAEIEQKLTSLLERKISMVTMVDPSLLGGLRVIAGNIVIDNSIKQRLSSMKKSVYKGVYSK